MGPGLALSAFKNQRDREGGAPWPEVAGQPDEIAVGDADHAALPARHHPRSKSRPSRPPAPLAVPQSTIRPIRLAFGSVCCVQR